MIPIKKWYACFVITLLASVYYFVPIFSEDIGSDTAVTRFNVQQIIAEGDRVAGFAALEAGFLMGGAGVTASWDTFFPVSGILDFNFATLNLSQDLITHNITTIDHLGNINGNGHIFELSESFHCIPSEGALDLCSVTFTYDDVEGASVNAVDFSFDSVYVTASEGNEFEVDLVVNENFLTTQDAVDLGNTVFALHWHPSKDFIAVGRASGAGDELYTYTFDRVGGTLTLIDSIDYGGGGNNSVNSVAWHPDGGHLAVGSDAAGQELRVYVVNADGTFGASTTVALSQDANSVSWNSDGSYLAVGTDSGGGWNDLRVYSFVESPLGLTLNASSDMATVNSVDWNRLATANGEVVVGLQSGSNRFRVYRHDGGAGTLTFIDGSAGTAVNAVAWSLCCNCIAAGLQDNSEGTGGELRTFSFENDTLDQEDDQELSDNVLSVAWSPNGRLLITGDDGLGGADPSIGLFRFDAAFIDSNLVTWDNLNIFLNSNIVFDFTAIKFSGECSIHGRGHSMSFAPSFTLFLDSNASIAFINIDLLGIGTDKFAFVDNTCTVSFSDVNMLLSDDFVFDTGHFEVLGDLELVGHHRFVYQSPEVSTILSSLPTSIVGGNCTSGFGGRLILDTGVTFSYDSVISSTLLFLEDEHAHIIMNNATLVATTSLQLLNGVLDIDGKCTFQSRDGIILGNGIAANNILFLLESAARINVATGKLINRNV